MQNLQFTPSVPLSKHLFDFIFGEMIFEHPFGDNFCDNFLSHTHIIFYFISLLL